MRVHGARLPTITSDLVIQHLRVLANKTHSILEVEVRFSAISRERQVIGTWILPCQTISNQDGLARTAVYTEEGGPPSHLSRVELLEE